MDQKEREKVLKAKRKELNEVHKQAKENYNTALQNFEKAKAKRKECREVIAKIDPLKNVPELTDEHMALIESTTIDLE